MSTRLKALDTMLEMQGIGGLTEYMDDGSLILFIRDSATVDGEQSGREWSFRAETLDDVAREVRHIADDVMEPTAIVTGMLDDGVDIDTAHHRMCTVRDGLHEGAAMADDLAKALAVTAS
ncbi:hypothetical protein [Bifidobacterium parmae]|uniref:Uncharacterized protein n=1 Tax=Bifidobacterium parmae TaxID=361854 RepID=A0A2N5J4W0_9BIFI|nr:hypothetical protein [Bifidobacterium parmae]PLS29217.1 hypothetical protein Uis4E_0637 [Bifidobacterium parmae]